MLTEKQKLFCEEYAKDLNGARAARAAGYSKDTARSIASETLTKPYIKKYIDKLRKKRDERLKVDQDKVIKELAKIGLADCGSDMGGFVVDLKNKIKALELLGKHTGAFNADESGKAVITVNIAKD